MQTDKSKKKVTTLDPLPFTILFPHNKFYHCLLPSDSLQAIITLISLKAMEDQSSTKASSIDPYKFAKIVLNPDGSLTRRPYFPSVSVAVHETIDSNTTSFKDVSLNPNKETFIRVYKPINSNNNKLPVLIYFHGGGFILFSATSRPFHDACCNKAAKLPAIIVSLDYRLAPEHRLPAAYEDALETIMWIRDQAMDVNGCDPWLKEHADFSKCFLVGGSAGANMVYHIAIRLLDMHISPVKIIGLVMNQPYFGGFERTKSEKRFVDDPILPLAVSDMMWSLALPEGADRDHEYCNPMAAGNGAHTEKIGMLPRCLVIGYENDPLNDKQREFVKMLEKHGADIVAEFAEGSHGVDLFDPLKAKALVESIKLFVNSSCERDNLTAVKSIPRMLMDVRIGRRIL